LPKRTLAGPIADESLVVFQFDVVTEDVDARQAAGSVG
jgi:hypothetical protein